jgi:hypothetical protein
VDVIFFVAGIALLRRLAEFFARHMAFIAFKRLVLAPQHKIRLVVVKGFFIEFCDLGVTTFVFGMATAARLRLKLAVKADFASHVSPHVLVASHAQAGLCLPVESGVTLLAVVFHFGMPLNHFARSQNRFDPLRTGKRCQYQKTYCQNNSNEGIQIT